MCRRTRTSCARVPSSASDVASSACVCVSRAATPTQACAGVHGPRARICRRVPRPHRRRHHRGHRRLRPRRRAAVPLLPGRRRPLALPGSRGVPVLRRVPPRESAGRRGARGPARMVRCSLFKWLFLVARTSSRACRPPRSARASPSGARFALLLSLLSCCLLASTVAPVMFGKPLLNNVLKFDHVQLQK